MASPHVAVVAYPFSSHAPKLLALARALATAAPSATFSFVSTRDSIARVRGPVPVNLKLVDALPVTWEKETPVWRQIELFLDAAEAGGLRQALDTAGFMSGGARVTCVVADAFMSMAAEVGVPWVAVWTGGPCALLAHLHADAIREKFGDNTASRGNELLTSRPGLGSFRVRDLPFGDPATGGEMFRVMSLLLRRVAERLPRAATATALNFFPGLFPSDVSVTLANAIPNSLPIGPYHLIPGTTITTDSDDDPLGCLLWLSRRPAGSVAYVSFGTVAALHADELRELALGLEASGAPFLWSLREDSWPLLPSGFTDRCNSGGWRLVPWAPQATVLRHEAVGAFVTHAGWGAVVEAMAGGVPMLCRPFFGDQMMNAHAVERVWGFGVTLENDAPVARGDVAAAVKMVLAGEEGARMRARARDLRDMIVRAFEHDGGSTLNFRKFVDAVCPPASARDVP